jgi:hypothetical protein
MKKKIFGIPVSVLLGAGVLAYVFRDKLKLTGFFDKLKGLFSKQSENNTTV